MMVCLFTGGAAFSQGDFGSDPEQCKMNISLYQDAMSRNDLAEAYRPWQNILELCPAWGKGVYQNGSKILNALIQKETDAARKQRLIDSLYLVYDMRMEHFGEQATVLGMKGATMLQYAADNCQAAFDIFKQAVELGGRQSAPEAITGYYQSLSCLYSKDLATKDQMLQDYVMLSEILDQRLGDPGLKDTDRQYYGIARDNVNNLFFRVAECPDLGRIVEEMVTAQPDDTALKTRMLKVLNAKDCSDEKIYRPLVEGVHRGDPSSESAYGLAMMMVRNNEMTNAYKYIREAVDLCNDCPDKVKYLMKAGQIASATGNHAQSRSYAQQILQLDPKNGEAYMLIGNAVASQASSCEGNEVWGVYWLAYDYYQRAKSNDPNVSEKARDRMEASQGRFPTSQDLFFNQLSEGGSFQVTCGGLNESTTIRSRKN
jgi:tetratricopeptide (TPR) repeat protein